MTLSCCPPSPSWSGVYFETLSVGLCTLLPILNGSTEEIVWLEGQVYSFKLEFSSRLNTMDTCEALAVRLVSENNLEDVFFFFYPHSLKE